MSQENVEVVREVWDAYSRGDYDRIAGFHDPHIVVITLEDGVLYGNDAVLANYKRWNEAWEGAAACTPPQGQAPRRTRPSRVC